MTAKVDRKLQEVPVAEYRYRHEAEFAAGFLEDAGIPYRLQIDDAGGADLGLAMLRPAVLWVRAVDAEAARDLVSLEQEEQEQELHEPPRHEGLVPRISGTEGSGLTLLERTISVVLAVTLLAVAPNLPPMPVRDAAVAACFAVGLVLAGSALIGRAPGPLAALIRMLSGTPPR